MPSGYSDTERERVSHKTCTCVHVLLANVHVYLPYIYNKNDDVKPDITCTVYKYDYLMGQIICMYIYVCAYTCTCVLLNGFNI